MDIMFTWTTPCTWITFLGRWCANPCLTESLAGCLDAIAVWVTMMWCGKICWWVCCCLMSALPCSPKLQNSTRVDCVRASKGQGCECGCVLLGSPGRARILSATVHGLWQQGAEVPPPASWKYWCESCKLLNLWNTTHRKHLFLL